MIHPPRVLPSNAPPLAGEGNEQPSRVLQEHSGNRQATPFTYGQGYGEQKTVPASLGENTYPSHPMHSTYSLYSQPPASNWHPDPRGRTGYVPSTCRRKTGYITAAEKALEAQKLYRRFLNSDSYAKYRQRQQKDDKGNQEQKWPDHLEEAFFRGTHRPLSFALTGANWTCQLSSSGHPWAVAS